MKKIKPKLPLEKEKTRPFYRYDTGHYSFNIRKTNMVCQNPDCKYTSRVFIRTDLKIDEDYQSSKNCPIHNLPLINFGNSSKIPKVGSKERKYWLFKYMRNE
jgi:hypothetical protein